MRLSNRRTNGALLGATALAAATIVAATPASAAGPADGVTTGRATAPYPVALPGEIGGSTGADKAAARRYSKRLAARMNAVRRHHDLRPLRLVDCLDGFAGSWARHLARTGDFYHQDLGPIMRRCHLASTGEIIAKGRVTPRQMIRMWLDSPGHRELLLEPSFRIAGVAGRRGHGSWVGCIDFGRR